MISGADTKAQQLESLAIAIDPAQLGTTLVLAPHPDDESLGCGGTIALLRAQGIAVHILFVSDGTMSHPNSPTYPAARLQQVREAEALEAIEILGVDTENITFMRQKDSQVVTPDKPGFADAVMFLTKLLEDVKPDTVLLPWRRDPHRDHRATWQLLRAAVANLSTRPRVLEYLIWLWELGHPEDMPRPDEMRIWRVDIDTVMAQRNRAIAAHRSQVTRLIDDDPTGFYLSPELLTHFDAPRELFLEE